VKCEVADEVRTCFIIIIEFLLLLLRRGQHTNVFLSMDNYLEDISNEWLLSKHKITSLYLFHNNALA